MLIRFILKIYDRDAEISYIQSCTATVSGILKCTIHVFGFESVRIAYYVYASTLF